MYRILFASVLFALIGSVPAQAQWWWPFGARDDWAAEPQTIQDREASPHMDNARIAQQDGWDRTALREYRRVWRKFPGSRYAPQALYQTAQIRMDQRNWRRAFEAHQRLIRYYPDFPHFNRVIADQFDIAMALAEGDGVRTLWLIPSRNFERSVAYFEQVVRNAPFTEYAPLALMNIAMIERYRRNEARAIDALDRLINNYPASILAADAYMNLAETFASLVDGPLYDQGATREAISYYEDFLILYPESELVSDAEIGLEEMQEIYARSRYVLGRYYFRYRRHYVGARVFLNEAITIAPESRAAADARALLERVEEAAAREPEPDDQEVQARRSIWERLMFWRSRDEDEDVRQFEEAQEALQHEEEASRTVDPADRGRPLPE